MSGPKVSVTQLQENCSKRNKRRRNRSSHVCLYLTLLFIPPLFSWYLFFLSLFPSRSLSFFLFYILFKFFFFSSLSLSRSLSLSLSLSASLSLSLLSLSLSLSLPLSLSLVTKPLPTPCVSRNFIRFSFMYTQNQSVLMSSLSDGFPTCLQIIISLSHDLCSQLDDSSLKQRSMFELFSEKITSRLCNRTSSSRDLENVAQGSKRLQGVRQAQMVSGDGRSTKLVLPLTKAPDPTVCPSVPAGSGSMSWSTDWDQT